MTDPDAHLSFHPFQLEHVADPYPRFARLRRERPVSRPWPGLYVVVRDAEVRAIVEDPGLWSNRCNHADLAGPTRTRQLALSQLDEPEHGRLRTLFRPAFASTLLSALEPALAGLADALAAQAAARLSAERTVDLVSQFAMPFAARALSRFVGVEPALQADYRRWSACFRDLVGQRAHPEWPNFRAWAMRAVRQPAGSGHSVLDALRALVASDTTVDEEELVTFLHFLIVAGVPNVQHALGNLLHRLLSESAWDALPSDEVQRASIVEEGLRLDPPALWQMRTATRATMICDTAIAAGARVVAVTASANRDERKWAEAERFLPQRPELRSHLAFGRGPHACLGAALARLELRTALAALRAHLPTLSLSPGFRYQRAGDFISRGPTNLTVVRPVRAVAARSTRPVDHAARWLHRPEPRASAITLLVCCPHAGGTAASYYAWARRLPTTIELAAVQYPGRMERAGDTHPGDMHTLVDALVSAVDAAAGGAKRVALFGHSMGASVAFETALRLEQARRTSVVRLFASGRPGPSRQQQGTVHTRDDDGLAAELMRLGGTHRALLENREVRSLLLPTLRADYALIERYRPPAARVRCPIGAFVGDRDSEVDVASLSAWRDATEGLFSLTVLPGDHFYLTTQLDALLAHLVEQVEEDVGTHDAALSLP